MVSQIIDNLIAANKMTYLEGSALFRYTYYNPVSQLGGSSLINPVFLPANHGAARIIDDALSKFANAGYAVPEGTITTRGACYNSARITEFRDAKKLNEDIVLPVVLSSSLDNTGNVAKAFINQTYQAGLNERAILTITTKNGINVDQVAHWGSNFTSITNPGIIAAPNLPFPQLEVLQRANSSYEVTNIIDDYASSEYPGELLIRIFITEK